MASYKVEICGVNTSRLPVLSETEKASLLERVKAGDKEAREDYIKGNQGKEEMLCKSTFLCQSWRKDNLWTIFKGSQGICKIISHIMMIKLQI